MEQIIFSGIVGSHAHGTATETSDKDIATIYMCDKADLLGLEYKEHDDIDKDNRRYELGKFIKLLMVGNPNMLELLYLPEDCILQTSEQWKEIVRNRDKFLTKQLKRTFSEYAKTQISKAKGLNKKINWEKEKTERKTVLDFCYYLPCYYEKSEKTVAYPVKTWLKENEYSQEQCGLVGIDHFRYCYLLYIDEKQGFKSDNPRFKEIEGFNFKGIVSNEDIANDIALSSVPAYCLPRGILYFNKDGYSSHCKDYREYQEWIRKRNENRYNTNKEHGQEYDSKNIAHVVRLLKTARDIVEKNTICVRRSAEEVDYILKIKKGQENLEKLVDWADEEYKQLEILFEKSNLPEEVDKNFCNKLLIQLRQ